ncbi:MAG: aminotransferase class V-fold PLP-dependent enzyme [Gammaproteobacteria bacterium]|nr:aminotransferase class V-fold PLP-dependent enzyme [Gammaproteobacteria bacterium]
MTKPWATLPAPKSDFIGLEGVTHLATGGQPPLLQAHRQAFEAFATDKSIGADGYSRHWAVVDEVRTAIADMVNAEPGDIAMTDNASEGIAKVTDSIAWQPGDNAVVSALDYASGRYNIARLRQRGIDVRFVAGSEWVQHEDALLEACDARTRLVYVAQVNATTGQHMDMQRLSAQLYNTGTVLLNDASHAMGAIPVDADHADFTVWSNYKFLLGVHDGVLVWNRRRHKEFVPRGIGWAAAQSTADPDKFILKPDARRAEYGNVGHLGAYLLRESLSYLGQFEPHAVAAHVRRLSGQMLDGYERLGLEVLTPVEPQRRAANAAFRHPAPERVVQAASSDRILVWGDNNRVRASAHLFATEEDVARYLEHLPNYLR